MPKYGIELILVSQYIRFHDKSCLNPNTISLISLQVIQRLEHLYGCPTSARPYEWEAYDKLNQMPQDHQCVLLKSLHYLSKILPKCLNQIEYALSQIVFVGIGLIFLWTQS